MEIEAVGVVALILGGLCLAAGPSVSIVILFISTLFGAAAAVVLPALGFVSITPAHLLLGFVALASVIRRDWAHRALGCFQAPRAGLWLLFTAIYTIASAFFVPRLLEGLTYVYAVARTQIGAAILLLPLAPVAGNVTQTIYFVGDLLCFVVFYGHASAPGGLKTMAKAGVACAAFNLALGGLDLLTYWTGTADWMQFIRNANYTMLNDTTVEGFKRIVGAFPEASAYAYATLGLFAFTVKLWVQGIWARFTAPIAGLSFLALVFSTSTTAYGGLALFCCALYIERLLALLTRPVSREAVALVTVVPLLGLLLATCIALDPAAVMFVQDIVDKTLLTKLSTNSGVTRVMWNNQAFTNFVETYGLGAGVGSVRASSFLAAVPGSVGVIGSLGYGAFLYTALRPGPPDTEDPFAVAVQRAARWACFALLIAASIAGSFIDLGLPFFIFAAMACARPGGESTR